MIKLLMLIGTGLMLTAGSLAALALLRNRQTERQLFRRLPVVAAQAAPAAPGSRLAAFAQRLIHDPQALRHTHPTRRLLASAGYGHEHHHYQYMLLRIALPLCLAVAALLLPGIPARLRLLSMLIALIVGLLLPERVLRWRAAARAASAGKELLLFIDLLRMLQGAGMSVGQALLVAAEEFASVLPVLAPELVLANQRYQGGRNRRESLEPLAELFNSADFSALAQLMDRLERYGGAAEEPLAKFGERLLEQQRLGLKTVIGQLSVKMTGVMVLFMLPALFILLAGPGFISLLATLQHAGGR
ncbi:type II secretion system F family protein [Jeongeupia sp. USM3]|uniref:type II secretion system F family protein n=1 Tax=Jeongeupia sp. USM3 TaxID=1906741 RepID=UPI00089E0757|nr:type II secretion system F family protein [Jeongeupia sp. USM3]AOY01202.1 hypothetical protein BJP62_12565 [Jeongeupia sp. USM3]